MKKSSYTESGVNIDAQDEALRQVKSIVRDTFTPGVISEIGSFGGLFKPDVSDYRSPILVSSRLVTAVFSSQSILRSAAAAVACSKVSATTAATC